MLQDVLDNLYSDNIAEQLDEDTLKSIAQEAIDGYMADEASCSEWMDRIKDYLKLASQIVEAKNFPWPGAANIKFPALTEAALQFAARANIALFPSSDIVKGKVVGQDPTGLKQKRAIRLGKHMSYQLLEEMDGWEDDMDKLLHIIPIIGCAFKKTYYDPACDKNVSELVLPQNLVVDYWAKSLETAWRVTEKLHLNSNDIYENVQSGIFLDQDYSSSSILDTDSTTDQIQGRQQQERDASTPEFFIAQHTYLDLDEDGYAEPVIITVHVESGKVARIVARYDEDGVYESDYEEGAIRRIEPVHYFTKYGFIPNPDGGFYDFGFGLYLYGINKTIDTTINQLLDAGTLATTGGGFLGRGAKIEGGNHAFKPFEWKAIRSTGDDLRKNVFPLPVREPSAVLFNLLGLMIQSAQRLAGTVDSLVGENPGQNQKATTTQMVMAEGQRVFHSIYKRTFRALTKEVKKVYRLNKFYLNMDDYLNIIDPVSEEEAKMAMQDYEDKSMDVVPSADPNISNEQQRMMQANSLLQLIPLGLNQTEVKVRVLEAQNQPNIERLLQMPPPQPSLEELQFQAEREDKQNEFIFKMLEHRDKSALNKATIIEKLAKAEATEFGNQLELYKAKMEQILQEETNFQEQIQKMLQPKEVENGSEIGSEGMA